MPSIVSLDPGKTTGAIYWWEADWEATQLYESEVTDYLDRKRPNKIVMESFQHRPTPKADMTPVGIIKEVSLWATRNNIVVVLQPPAIAKHFWTNDKLKKLGLYTTGMRHANDAMRHLLRYLVKYEERTDLLEALLP